MLQVIRSAEPLKCLKSVQALRKAGRYIEAESELADASKQFPDDQQLLIAHASLANARQDWPAALSRWEQLRLRFPNNPWCYVGSIDALRGAGRTAEIEPLAESAASALDKARQRGLSPSEAARVEFELARARSDWKALRRAAEHHLASGARPTADALLALAHSCLRLHDLQAADRHAAAALIVDPLLIPAWIVRVQVAIAADDGEAALAYYQTLASLQPHTVRWRFKRVQLLRWLGRHRESRQEFKRLRADSRDDP